MPSGEIRGLKTEQGFGFIREDGETEDIFFHATSLAEGTFDRLSEGQAVSFDRKSHGRATGKTRAVNVRPLTEEANSGRR
jgi:cold shock CspA family protein